MPGDLNCLVKVPGNANIFDVSFKTANVLERFWNLYREGKDRPPLSDFQVEPPSDTESKVVTVYDVSPWLGRNGEVKSESWRVLDEDGIWTGVRKWLVQLKPDPSAGGGGGCMSHPQLHHAGETPGRGVLRIKFMFKSSA